LWYRYFPNSSDAGRAVPESAPVFRRLAIIGQGLIGSSIARGVYAHGIPGEVVVTDSSPRVRARVKELGIGAARIVDSNREAVEGADLVIACVPVGAYGQLAQDIGRYLQPGCVLSDVGSVKGSVVRDMAPHLPAHAHFIPGHPLAGTERSGPDSGLADLFENRWCILTPPDGADAAAVERLRAFWSALGSQVEVMSIEHHDYVLAITSHLPHLIAFTIFHTAIHREQSTNTEVIKYSAGGFKDFTRIASSNPTMWRDIFLNNREAVLGVLKEFNKDLAALADAIERGDAEKLVEELSKSRLMRRKVIEKEHISLAPRKLSSDKTLAPPYAGDD
jgi:cyclohexadieny/prephenate dehydrogenase